MTATDGLTGKVAFITGVARGQGRAHAVRLARAGCDIIGIDICADLPTVSVRGAGPADLDDTVALVEAADRRIVARVADVRDLPGVEAAVADTLGPIYSHALPHRYVEPEDVADLVAWLVSDANRYMTGAQIPIDLGSLIR